MKNSILLTSLLIFLSFFLARPATACPEIDGLKDINCDGSLTIIAFGDSITFGVQDSQGLGYPGRLLRYFPNAIIYNEGIPGESTDIGRVRATNTFNTPTLPDYTIILEGVNDYWERPISAQLTKDNLIDIRTSSETTGALTFLSRLTHVRNGYQDSWVSAVNSAISPFTTIDFFSLGKSIIGPDLLHPDSHGYDQMATLLANTIQDQSNQLFFSDTDNDGIYDFGEIIYGSDPLRSDTDNDNLNDLEEVFTWGSDPTLSDSDSDGLTDFYEVQTLHTDPTNPAPGTPIITKGEILLDDGDAQ